MEATATPPEMDELEDLPKAPKDLIIPTKGTELPERDAEENELEDTLITPSGPLSDEEK